MQCCDRTRNNFERQKESLSNQTEEESLVAEICVSHAFFVTEITTTFDRTEQHYAGFCAMTAYRLSSDDAE